MLLKMNRASGVIGVRIHSNSDSDAFVTMPCETIFSCVAQHTGYSIKTLLFGDPKLNHKQNYDIFEAVQYFITLFKTF